MGKPREMTAGKRKLPYFNELLISVSNYSSVPFFTFQLARSRAKLSLTDSVLNDSLAVYEQSSCAQRHVCALMFWRCF